jgi:hypothetical protein
VEIINLKPGFVEVEEAYFKQNQMTHLTRLDRNLIQSKLFRLWKS